MADTSISAFVDKGLTDIVYHGKGEFVSTATGGEITITFDTPYIYCGGNLLIGCDNTTDSGFKNIYFYGQSVDGASISGSNGNSLNNVNPTQRNFAPTTTFTYIPSGGLQAPASLTATDVTCNSATLTWSGSSGKYNVEFKASDDADWTHHLSNTTATTCTLTNLTGETLYQARVQTVDANDNSSVSAWKTVTFTTPVRFHKPTGLTSRE